MSRIIRDFAGVTSRSTKRAGFAYAHTAPYRKSGFTLAEVLITLGIIGVVAAMTMPSLINRTRNKELHSQFLKVYSELNQIALKFKADNEVSIPEYSFTNGLGTTTKKISEYYKGTRALTASGMGDANEEGVFLPYYSINHLGGGSVSTVNSQGRDSSFYCDNTGFKANVSGMIYIFNDGPTTDVNGPVVCVDINGQKKPNMYGVDYFMFIFTKKGTVIPMGAEDKDNINIQCLSSTGSCTNFANKAEGNCKKGTNIGKSTTCAYYALLNQHPENSKKNYWQDFLGEISGR